MELSLMPDLILRPLSIFIRKLQKIAFAIDKVFESLVTFDNDGNIIDWLAEDHKISDDGLVYTFTLRDGLKFSDGTDVTAEDVKFSIERHLEVGVHFQLRQM